MISLKFNLIAVVRKPDFGVRTTDGGVCGDVQRFWLGVGMPPARVGLVGGGAASGRSNPLG